MLVPVEERDIDRANNDVLAASYNPAVQPRRLIYVCCSCTHTKIAESPVVYTVNLETDSLEGHGHHVDRAGLDDLPIDDSKQCPKCGAFKTQFLGTGPTTMDETYTTRYRCTACGNEWVDSDQQ